MSTHHRNPETPITYTIIIPHAQSIKSRYEVGAANEKKRVITVRIIFNNVSIGPTTKAKSPKIIEFAKIFTAKTRAFNMKVVVFATHVTKFSNVFIMILVSSANKVNNAVPRVGNPNPLPTQFKKFTT